MEELSLSSSLHLPLSLSFSRPIDVTGNAHNFPPTTNENETETQRKTINKHTKQNEMKPNESQPNETNRIEYPHFNPQPRPPPTSPPLLFFCLCMPNGGVRGREVERERGRQQEMARVIHWPMRRMSNAARAFFFFFLFCVRHNNRNRRHSIKTLFNTYNMNMCMRNE